MKHDHRFRDLAARLGVGRLLALAFAALMLMTAVVGGVSLTALSLQERKVDELARKWLAGVGALAEARASLTEMREFEVKHSRSTDKSYHAEYEEKLGAAGQATDKAMGTYKALVAGGEESALFAAVDKSWGEYRKFSAQVVKLGKDKAQTDAADLSDGAASMALDDMLGALTKLTRYNFTTAEELAAKAEAAFRETLIIVGGLIAGALVLGIVLAVSITRGLLRQLGGEPAHAVAVARAVAAGDLTTSIALRPGDDRSLMAALSTMQVGLARAVRQVREGSESVASASSQIAEGNQDLSGRTEQQASALQQTAATMDQLGATVRNNAENARQANVLAAGAAEVATKGGAVVGQVVETMRGINESSRRIADILSVIDGIAFQTNILALNAAVEAARAGEQGRGFAVVAAEVRSLAHRSAEAAKEIKGLIGASVERVEQGTAQVDRAGHTMDEIVSAIGRVSTIVAEITAASAEQSSGVSQMGQAVAQMDQATQQNAALVEQSAAAAESLRQQARQLVDAVAVFRVA